MFERLFQRAVRSGSRLLFAAALVMLLWGVAYAVDLFSNRGMAGLSLVQQGGWLGAALGIIGLAFKPATQLFFGSLVVYQLEQWVTARRQP